MAIATWDVPVIETKQFTIKCKTDVDSEYTAHEQRNKLYSLPRLGWSLRVEKTASNYQKLRAFFLARAGRFNAFYWVWDSAIDEFGDDQQYLVRFDTDELNFDDSGDFWVVPIVQVVTSE